MACWNLGKQFSVAYKALSSLPSTKKTTQEAHHIEKDTKDKWETTASTLVS